MLEFPFPVFTDFVKKNRGILGIEINQAFLLLKILPMHLLQIRSIENYWGILKMKVYEGNWTAKTRDHLIRRIKID